MRADIRGKVFGNLGEDRTRIGTKNLTQMTQAGEIKNHFRAIS